MLETIQILIISIKDRLQRR